MTARILAFSGSSRRDSLNLRVLNAAAAGARQAGAEVTVLSLGDLALPIYNGDEESVMGLPAGALRFQAMLADHDAVLIATPEYNGGYTALLKNALDWASRPSPGQRSGLAYLEGKLVAMVSASPGLLGGIRSQVALQGVLHKLGMHVIAASFALGSAHKTFDEEGVLTSDSAAEGLHNVGRSLARAATVHLQAVLP